MEMTLTEDWQPKPGVLIEFTPTAASLAATQTTAPSDAPATYLQESHIRRWSARRQSDDPLASELSLCFSIASPLDPEALRRTYTAFLRRHETLRSWFRLDESDGKFDLTRYLLDPDAVELATSTLGTFTDSGELRDTLVAKFKANADPTRWPAIVCCVIDHGGDEGFTVVYSADHAFTDGLSVITSIYEFHAMYYAFTTGQEPALPPVGSYVEFARAERAAVAAEPPELERLATLLAENAERVRPLPIELGLAPGELADSFGTKVVMLDAAQCDAFAAACKSAGGSFSAGLYAAIALAELEFAGRTSYLGLNVVGTRGEPQYQLAQGWFVNLMPISFELDGATRFTDLIGRAGLALEWAKPLANVPIHAALARAAELTGAPLPVTTDWPWVSYMDVRAISGAALENALPGVSGINGLGSRSRIGQTSPIWFNRELERLHVTMMYPDTPIAHESAAAYLEQIRTTLRAIADTGDFAVAAPALARS
ncbi:condensation domain-containing protein [Nocardia tenerifensis]|uniref:Condensation domain-containing protein n=1 Tax=Nocardia tenerifensis TaxID=228006 RepID=A0A318JST3_9NOCA|nr:condensation domain-containing protein [Nocardia tenerifensis]PXX59277.1 condensation domain-containing protein [Nocardia tenerifensis]